MVIGDEEPSEYEALLNGLIGNFAPASSLEFELIEQLASLIWRIRRIPRLEAAILEFHRAEILGKQLDPTYEESRRAELARKALRFLPKQSSPAPPLPEGPKEKKPEPVPIWRQLGAAFVRDAQNGDMLGKLSRYESSLMHGLTKTLNMLFQVQSQRVEYIQTL
jgi:hypothetical protein